MVVCDCNHEGARRQERQEFEVIPSYITNVKLACATQDLTSKANKQANKTERLRSLSVFTYKAQSRRHSVYEKELEI